VSGGLKVGRTQLEVGMRNALNRAYPELRAGGFVSPGHPRSVYGTLRYAF